MSAKKRDPKVTSRIMSCVHSKNTRPEIALGKMLWRCGVRYRKHYKITGSPDFVIVSRRMAIFLDGDFWHGHNWKLRGLRNLSDELSGYKPFWANKIKNNIKRDRSVDIALRKEKWKVLRFWESQLKSNPDRILRKTLKVYGERKPA